MAADPTRFTHALLRTPAKSAVNGLRDVDRGAPDIDVLVQEHAAYEAALRDLGVQTRVLPALEEFPDSVYMEDPALVFGSGAILLRPGAPSRFGEAAELKPVLEEMFPEVIELQTGFSDGGDVLLTRDRVLIGLSARTNQEGAEELVEALARLGRKGEIVKPSEGVLHFKTACGLVGPNTVLATKELLSADNYFAGMEVIEVPEGEEPVANALAVNGTVLIADGFLKTEALLRESGFIVRTLPLDQTMKLDAGLSCMSLRW